MKKALALLIPALLLGIAAPAAADEKKKCGAEATICVREMAENLKKRGWIGIEWDNEGKRPEISHVVQGSPAEKAGVRVGDTVMAFAGVSTDEEEETIWKAMKKELVPGRVITLDVVRDGRELALDVELIAVPEHVIAQWIGKHVLDHHQAPPEDQVAAEQQQGRPGYGF